MYENVESIICGDLVNILGYENILNSSESFHVYVHLIRTEVATIKGLFAKAEPTPQGYQHSKMCKYQAIHLVNRMNVSGGVNYIKFCDHDLSTFNEINSSNHDGYLLLDKCMDSLFFKNSNKGQPINRSLYHKTSEIELLPEQNYGLRDILVIEFE